MELTRCKRCLLPASVEGISFDTEGVCNHCRNYERDFSDWNGMKDRKAQEFKQLPERDRSLKRPYDCLILLSGGKDSTYTLYHATKENRLLALAVTLKNG